MERLLLSLIAAWLILSGGTVSAATYAAATCENKSGQLDVQNAITLAVTGDTVTVPAGNCTWTTTVTITNKGIIFEGAGMGVTNITDQGASNAALIVSANSDANLVTVTGFSFIKSANHGTSGMVIINGTAFVQAFRFHHNRISHATSGARGIQVYDVFGLIDHNEFIITALTGSIQQISVEGQNNNAGGGYTPWTRALNPGSNEAVYIENNTITNASHDESALDAYGGAKVVSRYNTIDSAEVGGGHGMDSGNRRSQILAEVYRNDYTQNSATNIRAQGFRGGTGMLFQNTYAQNGAGAWYGPQLLTYRAGEVPAVSQWGHCDGTQYVVGSSAITSQASRMSCAVGTASPGANSCAANPGPPSYTWIADYGFDATNPDTIPLGVHGTGNNTAFMDGAGTGGYPCHDQIGRGPGQVLTPFYSWDEDRNWDTPDPWGGNYNGLGAANYMLENRDFYNESAAVGSPQTVGVRVGVLASRPAGCTAGVGYWATDQGTWNQSGSGAQGVLYKCTATDTWTLYYTPYTYPHPLIPASTPPAPDPLTDAGRIMNFSGNTFAIFTWPASTDSAHKQYNVYRCIYAGACTVLVKTITPASAAASYSPENRFFDSSLYVAGTYYFSVSDVNTSDYVGTATTPVSISVTGKQ